MTQWGLDTLFNPAKRHMDEEKRRLQTTREQLGDSSGGKRIDLESGKVTIRKKPKPGEIEAEDTDQTDQTDQTDPTDQSDESEIDAPGDDEPDSATG
jgi:hypothetical protein